jgi:anti-sigma factor RsiW
MDCIKKNRQGVEILTDYCAGILDPAAAAEIDVHIAQCADCREMVEAQRIVWEMLDAWNPLEVSRDFDARLYARIAQEQAEPVWRRWLGRVFRPATPYAWWKPAVSLAAAGAVLALALVVGVPDKTPFAHTTPSAFKSTTVQAAAGYEEVDLDQVQQALDDLEIVTPAGQSPSSPL